MPNVDQFNLNQLNQIDTERIINFYTEALIEYGINDARSVHWSSEHNQRIRFEVLSRLGKLNHHSLLDVGCGLGDLYAFLLHKNISVEYIGIDIVAELIAAAQLKFPQTHFEEKNILDIPDKSIKYDYVIASGALSFKVKDYKDYYFRIIKKMYDISTCAVGFNMLNSAEHIDDAEYATYSPHEITDYCQTFCTNIQIYTDYLPQDFTVFLYK